MCDKSQKIKVLEEICKTMSEVSDDFGTHPIQNLIELNCSQDEYKLYLSPLNE